MVGLQSFCTKLEIQSGPDDLLVSNVFNSASRKTKIPNWWKTAWVISWATILVKKLSETDYSMLLLEFAAVGMVHGPRSGVDTKYCGIIQ